MQRNWPPANTSCTSFASTAIPVPPLGIVDAVEEAFSLPPPQHRMAFVPAPVLSRSPRRAYHKKTVVARASPPDDDHGPEQWHVQDTFSGFEALCWRAQHSLCAETAAADGLGTFEATPAVAPHSSRTTPPRTSRLPRDSHATRARAMRGGRAFASAVVSVWRAAPPSTGRNRMLAHLAHDARVRHKTDAVGLSLRLQPRDPTAPALRADAHYFQLGGGDTSWWFSGAADLILGPRAPPNVFERDVRLFLSKCRAPCEEHRASAAENSGLHGRRQFLETCFHVEDELPGERMDRASAFAFMVDVVDLLLPSYLPLVRPGGSREPVPNIGVSDPPNLSEFTERFGLRGGASCESEVAQAASLGSWRFTLAPRETSIEGKRFWALRNDENAGRTPPAYL